MIAAISHKIDKIQQVLSEIGPPLIACSGGLDSLLLATIAHRLFPRRALIIHAESPAVPEEARTRLRDFAAKEGWRVEYLRTGEFEDEEYLRNPFNRCYFCKKHLYAVLSEYGYDPESGYYGKVADPNFEKKLVNFKYYPILSGANTDDLKEFRPGLEAAKEFGVRHPFIEARISKGDIRELCRLLELPIAELAASPCLSSRIYTGTRVCADRLRLIDTLESQLKTLTGVKVVRCRLKQRSLLIEVLEEDRQKFTEELLSVLKKEILSQNVEIEDLTLDPLPYKSGRAFVSNL